MDTPEKRPALHWRLVTGGRVVTYPSSASQRLAHRLDVLRDKHFVGRDVELAAFRAALDPIGGERSIALVYVYGPGGVGKSVLLRQFSRLATATGARVLHVDGRDIEPSPAGLLSALGAMLNTADPLEALARDAQRAVLLVDTYEVLAPIDSWLRDVFLPQIPEPSLVVLAGRQAPAQAWRADPAWSELTHIIPLRNLLPNDSRAYLRSRGVPEHQHPSVLDFTHGHPLALALIANLLVDQAARPFRPEHAPDLVRNLLERFVDRVPSQAHWRALAVCAHARVTTEALLGQVLGRSDAPALFGWLRDLPFVEQGDLGVFPHDVARDVLDADLRWRDPVSYAELHARIRDALVPRLRAGSPMQQQAAYFDFLYLVRHSAVSRAYYDWTTFGHLYAEIARASDHAEIIRLVQHHEGDASARIAEYWLARQPEAFVVFRGAGEPLAGFAAPLLLADVTSADLAADPGVAAAWQFVARRGPLRPGERIIHHRFFVGREGYQDVAIHNMVAMVATLRWLTTPRLAWSFPILAEPERWAPLFESIRFPRTPEADFEVGGRRYGAFSHDWRADPLERWIEIKTALDPDAAGSPADNPAPPLEVLSRPDFEAAVRQALRDLHRPALAANPLLRSRVAATCPSASSLKALLQETAAAMRGPAGSRSDKLYSVLDATFFIGGLTQESAAERLGLPFNTYRYQLANAVKWLTDALWERELA